MKEFKELRDQIDKNNLECVGRIKELEAECLQKTKMIDDMREDTQIR